MIPIKDYNPAKSFPIISILLIVINIAVYVVDRATGQLMPFTYETARGMVTTHQFVGGLTEHYALVPKMATSQMSSWFTVFTSMFLHGNLLHIGSNMLYLWIFGNNIEDTLGRVRFILFYFACGIFAALAQIMSNPESAVPMVGASGAIAGVMGAYLIIFPHAKVLTLVPIFFFFTFIELPAIIIIGYWALLQIINASWLDGGVLQGGGVAYYAHIGGFAAGIIWIIVFGPDKRKGSSHR